MKVIVVGAGIAGLTFAYACHRLGFDVKVYEKAKKLSNIGGGILMWPHALRYLEKLELAVHLQPYLLNIEGCKIRGHKNQVIFTENYTQLHHVLGGQILPIDRSNLQQTLLMQLPQSIVHLNKTCQQIEENSNGVTITFSDGAQDHADFLVGADGIYSTVRNHFNFAVEPKYTGYYWWGGIVEQKYLPDLNFKNVYMSMQVGKIYILWPIQNDRCMWYMPVKMPLQNQTFQQEIYLQEICKNWDAPIQQIIAAPPVAKNFCLPICTLPPQTHWTTQRVALIGDAAHALGPILGQGASQAIEDAFVLSRCLQKADTNNISTMLTEYEILRREKYLRIAELENQAAEALICDDLETLIEFEKQAPALDLVSMYKDLVPFVDEKYSTQLIEKLNNLERFSKVA